MHDLPFRDGGWLRGVVMSALAHIDSDKDWIALIVAELDRAD